MSVYVCVKLLTIFVVMNYDVKEEDDQFVELNGNRDVD